MRKRHTIRTDRLDEKQMHALVQKLQVIAKDANHKRPLMIGSDQENGLSFRELQYDRRQELTGIGRSRLCF